MVVVADAGPPLHWHGPFVDDAVDGVIITVGLAAPPPPRINGFKVPVIVDT